MSENSNRLLGKKCISRQTTRGTQITEGDLENLCTARHNMKVKVEITKESQSQSFSLNAKKTFANNY